MKKWILGMGCFLCLAAPVAAEETAPAEAPWNAVAHRFGIFGNLGYSGYSMNDLNNLISVINQAAAMLGAGTMETISGGLSYNLGVEYAFSDSFLVGAEYTDLAADSKKTFSTSETFEFDERATEVGAYVKLAAPVQSNLLLSLGAGVYSLDVSGENSYSYAYGSSSTSVSGSAISYKFFGSAILFVSRNIALGVDAGYRLGSVTEVRNGSSVILTNLDGSNLTLDYSGPFGQAGLRYYF